jgi:hypothetical protein
VADLFLGSFGIVWWIIATFNSPLSLRAKMALSVGFVVAGIVLIETKLHLSHTRTALGAIQWQAIEPKFLAINIAQYVAITAATIC